MSKVPWDLLIDLVRRFPEGASLEDVMLGLTPPVPRRTVQRWLAELVKSQQISAIGEARARRYRLGKVQIEKELPSLLPISRDGQQIQMKVSQPIQKRRPVGYNREFLESYSPNQTFYLSEGLRKKLAHLGGGGDGQYPAGTYARQIFQRILIDLSWNSSRLEGNTYSLLETERLLEFGKAWSLD